MLGLQANLLFLGTFRLFHLTAYLAVPIQKWVRRRARQGGLPIPARVCLVSAATGLGVEDLLRSLHAEATATSGKGNVWVVRTTVFFLMLWKGGGSCYAAIWRSNLLCNRPFLKPKGSHY